MTFNTHSQETLIKLEIENFLFLIKNVNQKPTANIIHNDEIRELFLLMLGIR